MSDFYNPLLHLKRQFNGEVGTISIAKKDGQYEVWFEDFNIMGQGDSEVEALQEAALHAAQLSLLITKVLTQTQGSLVLTEEESQLVIGAIPLQTFPE